MKENIIETTLMAGDLKVAIIFSRFNELIVSKLYGGAKEAFIRHEGKVENITTVYVPGCFEIPLAAQMLARKKEYDAILCLGAVIRGSTSHYDFVAGETAKGISKVALDESTPVIFGVLTTENIEQAIERAGTKMGNKGYECMMSAIEMGRLMKKMKENQ